MRGLVLIVPASESESDHNCYPGNAESGQIRSTDLRIRNSCCFVGINPLLSMGNIWL